MRGYVELWACPHVDMSERQHEIMTKRPSLFAAKTTQAAPVEVEQPEPLPEIAATKKPSAKIEGQTAKPRGQARLVRLFDAGGMEAASYAVLNLESSTQSLGEEADQSAFRKTPAQSDRLKSTCQHVGMWACPHVGSSASQN